MTNDFFDVLSERDHKRIAEYIETYAGIQLPASKRSLIEGRLRKRQRLLGYDLLHSYIDFALESQEGQQERVHLLDVITTNKTDFYREPEHFRFLQQHVVQEFIQQNRTRPLRIWSAGCSSGEEPYTLAIEMSEIRRQHAAFNFEILATDISVSCLKTAKQAIYPHHRIEIIPMALRKRYLLRSKNKQDDLVCMSAEIKEKVAIKTFNLLTDSYHNFKPRFDVIFCRNVMIYFNKTDRMHIIHQFFNSLVPNGLFFIGHSESLTDMKTDFRQIIPAVYRKVSHE